MQAQAHSVRIAPWFIYFLFNALYNNTHVIF